MSEFLAEAQVRVSPNTTSFRAELDAAVVAATRRPIIVPVTLAPVATGGQAALTQSTQATTVALREQAAAQAQAGSAAVKAAADTRKFTETQGQLRKGVIASAAGLTGLRGAVLAASAPFLLATVGITAFSRALQSAAELEQSLNVFRVTARATAEEMEAVREQAKLLGRDLELPGVTATDAAEAFLTLSRAGLSVQDALAGGRGVLQLATAAQISFADAANLTSSALNAFALSGESAVDVADILTNAANASQGSIEQMGIALRQSAAIADLAGFSLSETATFLTQLAQAGLAGSDAGTSFRVAIQRLIAPTDAARKKLEDLNVNLRDVQGNLRPEAFFELGSALERMGRAQADATRQLIFGNDASRAAAFFARVNAENFRDQEQALLRSGSAAEIAAARNEGLAGSAENLKNQITALGIELGEVASPVVAAGLDAVALTFGLLATSVGEARKGLVKLGDDVEKLQEFFTAISDDSGFTDFLSDVSSGAKFIAEDISRASDATDEFIGSLLGISSGTSDTTRGINRLTQAEIDFARSLTDSHERVDIQVRDLRDLTTAAGEAAGAVARLTGQIAGIEEQVTRARISGDEGAELDLLEQERSRLQRLLSIQEGIVAEGGRGAATARRRIRQEILPQLESVNAEINRIIQGQRTATEQLRREAERARQERIDAAREAARAEEEAARIEEQLAEERREQRREARARLRERFSLAVDIAEATGNRAREIRAREAEINFIRDEIRQTRRNSLQRKRLILELRQAQRDLRELKNETKKTKEEAKKARNEFAADAFEFLQTQQGFAANLLGNLIPGFATGGLVGNVSPGAQGLVAPQFGPEAAVQGEAAIAGARERGVRPGQVETTNALLRRILRSLENLNGRAGHPEARYQKSTQSSFMDVIGT